MIPVLYSCMYFLHSLPLVILTEVSGLIGRYCGHFWVIREPYVLRQGRIFECEIFSVLSIAHAWTSVILAGNMIKNFFFFCGWNSTWTRTHICMTLPLLKAYFSWPLPFLQSQKVVTLPLFPPPSSPAYFWRVPWWPWEHSPKMPLRHEWMHTTYILILRLPFIFEVGYIIWNARTFHFTQTAN